MPIARETDPSTGVAEDKFHETVRDILGMSPFDRHDQIFAELRRLKKAEEDLDRPLPGNSFAGR